MSLLQTLGLRPQASVVERPAALFARRLIEKLERHFYAEAEQLLASASEDVRERLYYGLASSGQGVPLAAGWAKARPDSAPAHTALGASLIVSGWDIRGDGYADGVDASAWQPFLAALKDAQEPLRMAARLDPRTADPYAWLIHAELGGAGSRQALENLFGLATARVPLHWPAHYKYFAATTEKWGGSHREMFRFVQQASKTAPPGSLLHSLVAAAYGEYALALAGQSLAGIATAQNAALIRAALRAWLDLAADATADALAERLERVGGPFRGYALNHFAVACWLCGARAEARVLLQALAGEIESLPWAWLARGPRERAHAGFVHDRALRELGRGAPGGAAAR